MPGPRDPRPGKEVVDAGATDRWTGPALADRALSVVARSVKGVT
ncbi:hypothetical protein [Streptomyces sp. NPDC005012]